MRGVAPTVRCPRCGAEAPPGASAGAALIPCARCGMGYRLDEGLRAAAPKPRRAPVVATAPSVKITVDGDALVVRFPASRGVGIAAVLVALLVTPLFALFLSVPRAWEQPKFVALIVTTGVLAAVLWYAALGLLINHVEIRLDRAGVRVRRSPLPALRNHAIALDELDGFDVASRPYRGNQLYTIEALRPGGPSKTLCDARDEDQARAVAEPLTAHHAELGR